MAWRCPPCAQAPAPRLQATGLRSPTLPGPHRLKGLGEGSKQWSSSAPNLGKSPKHTPIAPGFASLNEMGKSLGACKVVGVPWPKG